MSLNQFYKLNLFVILSTISANYQFAFPISILSESSMGYDSNFLKLSERDELYGEVYPELIGDANSTSSIVGKQKFAISLKPQLFEYDTRVFLSIRSNLYFALDAKNYNSYNLKVSQNFGNYKWLKVNYIYTPYNYLREYYDRDNSQIYYVEGSSFSASERDSAATYGREKITIEFSYPIQNMRSTWMIASVAKEAQYYNQNFTEYDLDILHYRLGISWRYSRRIRIESKITFSYADNVGMQDNLNSTLFQDRGYNQKTVYFSWSKKNRKSFLDSFGFYQNIVFRDYTSEFPLYDILHFKRSHIDWSTNMWLSKKINHNLSIKVSMGYRSKDTDSNYAELLKTFQKFEYFLTLKYRLDI